MLEDTENGISCAFETHKFNETQEFEVRNNLFSAEELAAIMREIGDWMHKNAYFIAMPLRDENDVNAYIAEQVRCARMAKGWSKYRLSKETGITETQIGYIERGEHSVGAALLMKLSDALETNIFIQ